MRNCMEAPKPETPHSGIDMVNAIVMLNVQRRAIDSVAESVAEMKGVTAVYSVSGTYDLVVVVSVPDNEHLSDLVTHHILMVDEIQGSETMLAFKTFSSYDLDRMFSLGMEE